MKKIAAALLFASSLQGCSNGPSDTDVEAVISAKFAACQGLKVENTKIINGVDEGDGIKQVLAHYTVKVIPVDPSEISEYKEAKNEADEAQKQINKMYDDAEHEGIDSSGQEYQKYLQDHGWNELKAKTFRVTQMETPLMKWGGKSGNGRDCLRAIEYKVDKSVYGSTAIDSNNLVESGGESQMEIKITMIKSDNGWIEAQ